MSKVITIYDLIGIHSGMHYYDNAFAELLTKNGYTVNIKSNYSHNDCPKSIPNAFIGSKFIGIVYIFVFLLKYLFKIIFYRKENIIYLSYGELYDLPFLFFAKLSRRVIIDVHEVHALKYAEDSKISRLFLWLYSHCISTIIYHSQRTFDKLSERVSQKLFVPHFKYTFKKDYDITNISNDIINTISSDGIKFLFFGNLSTVKGIDIIVDIFPKLLSKFNCQLIIAGKNVDHIDFSNIEQNHPNAHIFSRHISDDELIYLYQNIDFVLLPYRKSSQSGILAMATYFRKPMLMSDIPYFRKIADEFPSFGKICDIKDWEQLIINAITENQSAYYTTEDCMRYENTNDYNLFLCRLKEIINR